MPSNEYILGMNLYLQKDIRSQLSAKGLSQTEVNAQVEVIRQQILTGSYTFPGGENEKKKVNALYKVPAAEIGLTTQPVVPKQPTIPVSQVPQPLPTKAKSPAPSPAAKSVHSSTQPKVEKEADAKVDSSVIYQLLWRTALVANGGKAKEIDITRVKTDLNMDSILNLAFTNNIILPLNSRISSTQEYSPNIQNKVVQYSTMGGNSVTVFGQGPKKIGLKVALIKAGTTSWINYKNAVEALHFISSNPGRYFGNMYLYGFDIEAPNKLPRKYKVTLESLNMSIRSDRNNIIDIDLTVIVNHDYSFIPIQNSGGFGRL